MPAADPARAGYAGGATVAGQGRDAPVRAWLRFFRPELRLIFGRRRNQALLPVVTLFPITSSSSASGCVSRTRGGTAEA